MYATNSFVLMNQLLNVFFDKREEPGLHCLHDEDALGFRSLKHFLCLQGIPRKGLFAKNILAVADSIETILLVKGVRCANVYDMYIGIGVNFFIAPVDRM
jgi:hypothetical protein